MGIEQLRPLDLSHADASFETLEDMRMLFEEFDRADLEALFVMFEEQENE